MAIELTEEELAKQKFNARMSSIPTPPVVSPAPTVPTSEGDINAISPDTGASTAITPTGGSIPNKGAPPVATAGDTNLARNQQQAAAVQPMQPMSPVPGELVLAGRQIQETGWKPVDETKIRAQQDAALLAEKKKNEASSAYDGVLKSLQITNAEEYDKAKAESDSVQKSMSDQELKEQTKFLTEYKAALDRFNSQPVPEKKGWWEISTTGEKVAAAAATVMAALLHSKTGDMSAVKSIIGNMDDRVNDDLEAQKAMFLAERDKLMQRRELNDIRAKSFRDSLAAIEAKRNIVLDDIRRKGELAIAKSPVLDEAQKAKNTAEFKALMEAKKVSNILETSKKVTTGDNLAPMKAGVGDPLESEAKRLDYISKAKTSLGINTPTSPMARHLAMKEAQQRIAAIEAATDPEAKRALSVELGLFIAETMNQGSFTPNMTGTIFPKSAMQDAKAWMQYITNSPKGHITDEQVASMKMFINNQLNTSGAKAKDQDLLKMADSFERAGIDRSELGVSLPPSDSNGKYNYTSSTKKK
jgi:hypothetical protein